MSEFDKCEEKGANLRERQAEEDYENQIKKYQRARPQKINVFTVKYKKRKNRRFVIQNGEQCKDYSHYVTTECHSPEVDSPEVKSPEVNSKYKLKLMPNGSHNSLVNMNNRVCQPISKVNLCDVWSHWLKKTHKETIFKNNSVAGAMRLNEDASNLLSALKIKKTLGKVTRKHDYLSLLAREKQKSKCHASRLNKSLDTLLGSRITSSHRYNQCKQNFPGFNE